MSLAGLRRPWVAFAVDSLLVLLFATIGRASHHEAAPVLGAPTTAWPFLVGTVVGWLLVRVLRGAWPTEVGPGITVWAATLVFGMVLRRLTGQGTALAFVLVAATILGLFLVGWRALALWSRKRYAASRAPARSERSRGAG